MENQRANTQYHPAFYAAMELELRMERKDLECCAEFVLNTKQNTVDFITKVKSGGDRKSKFSKMFKKVNLFEYKSPDSAMGIRIYYRSMAYMYLYLTYYDDVKTPDEMALIFIRLKKPEKLISQLCRMGFDVKEQSPGIYCVKRNYHVDMWIMVTRELGGEFKWLTKLSDQVELEDIRKMAKETEALETVHDRANAEAVFDLVMRINQGKQWIKEMTGMGEFRDLFKEEFERRDNQIAELREQLKNQNEQLKNKNEQLKNKDEQLKDQDEQLKDQSEQLKDQSEQLKDQSEQLKDQDEQLKNKKEQLRSKEEENSRLKEEIKQLKKQLGRIAIL